MTQTNRPLRGRLPGLARSAILTGALLLALPASAGQAVSSWHHYRGMCDASAVEMLNDDYFAVANDEDFTLRVYARGEEALPAQVLDMTSFLKFGRKKGKEADLEGAARIGDLIYWISSHGANAKGKFDPNRHRLFATSVQMVNGQARLAPTGRPYVALLSDLANHPALAPYKLAAAAHRPPKTPGALNIEGLTPTPDGGLLIGFRNPVPGGRALIVPLLNPAEVIQGKRAELGQPLLLDLGGMGVRSITLDGQRYLIVGGSMDGKGPSHLFEWKGGTDTPRRLTTERLQANAEGIAVFEANGERSVWMVSDDGTVMSNGVECKKLKDNSLKTFRTFRLTL